MTTKMGMHNRITKERYDKAKVELKSPKDDKRVMKKYGFGETTARRIRNTDNFYEYYSKTTTGRRNREHLENILADVRENDEYPLEFEEIHNGAIRPLAFAIVALACLLFVLGGTIILMIAGGQ